MEKRLRRDLRRTHALLSDVQLLLGTMEDGKTSVSKEELEKVHSQVGVSGPSELGCGSAATTEGVDLAPRNGCGRRADLGWGTSLRLVGHVEVGDEEEGLINDQGVSLPSSALRQEAP